MVDDKRLTARQEAWKIAVSWHLPEPIAYFRTLPWDEVKRIGEAVSHGSEIEPLHMTDRKFKIDGYRENLSGAQVAAVMVAALWVLCGENPDMCSGLVKDWPDLPIMARLAGSEEVEK